jgi:hypothetical protein
MENNVKFNDGYQIESISLLVIDYVNECASQGTPLPVDERSARPFVHWVYNHRQAQGISFNEILLRTLIVANFKASGHLVNYSYLMSEMRIGYHELIGLIVEAVLLDIGMNEPDTDSIVYDDVLYGDDPFFQFKLTDREHLMTKKDREEYQSVMIKRFCKSLWMKMPPIIDIDLKNNLRLLERN